MTKQMELTEIETRIETMVQKEMDHLRKLNYKGDLRAAAERRVGDSFWAIGLRWNRT
jgi:hypothetical protein